MGWSCVCRGGLVELLVRDWVAGYYYKEWCCSISFAIVIDYKLILPASAMLFRSLSSGQLIYFLCCFSLSILAPLDALPFACKLPWVCPLLTRSYQPLALGTLHPTELLRRLVAVNGLSLRAFISVWLLTGSAFYCRVSLMAGVID
jgi:hypothetical protein